MSGRSYLSIGDVLTMLREEFPDVTISKIRFLESQGLVNPERSPSGYRKFFDTDVERLRWVLRQQREHFLPLKVIRDRLAEGDLTDHGMDEGDLADVAAEVAEPARRNGRVGQGAQRAASPVAAGVSAGGGAGSHGGLGPGKRDWVSAGEDDALTQADSDAMARILADASRRAAMLPDTPAAVSGDAGAGSGAPTAAEPRRDAERAPLRVVEDPDRSSRAEAVTAAATPPAAPGRTATGTPGSAAAGAPDTGSSSRRGTDRASAVAHAPNSGQSGAAGATRGPSPAATPKGATAPAPAAVNGADSAASRKAAAAVTPPPVPPRPAAAAASGVPAGATSSGMVSGASLTGEELCAASGLSEIELAGLQGFGLIEGEVVAGILTFNEDALTVANLASQFRKFGIEPRHLRLYRNAVDRELGLIEQVIIPLLRQRNPESRQRAMEGADELAGLGQTMRAALLRSALRRHLGG